MLCRQLLYLSVTLNVTYGTKWMDFIVLSLWRPAHGSHRDLHDVCIFALHAIMSSQSDA